MNVLIVNDDNGVATGALAQGFVQLGHDAALWVPSKMPTHEAFARQKPDLFIGPSSSLTPALLRNQGKCRLALWQDNNPIFLEQLPPGTLLFAAEDNTQGLPVIQWPFLPLKQDLYADELATDVLILDEYDPRFDSYLIPLFENEGFVTRVYADNPWPVPYYAGSLSFDEKVKALASTIVRPIVFDNGWDIRKMYEALRVGAVPVVAGNEDYISYDGTPEGYRSLIKDIALMADEERQEIRESLTDLFLRYTPVDSAQAILRAMVTC